MKKRYLTIMFAVVVALGGAFWSCSGSDGNRKLDYALSAAGDNRAELEAVLEHYKGDSLKLVAAEFLIENAPFYYSYRGWELDSLKVADSLYIATGKYDKERFGYLFPLNQKNLEKIPDIEVLTRDFLIENIDYAFRAWREKPWHDQVPFEHFKQYILPYRIGEEPLTNWRKTLYEKYSPAIDSIYSQKSVVAACYNVGAYIKSMGWNYTEELNVPRYDALYIDSVRIGQCLDIADAYQNILRAVGIPVSTDCYLHAPGNFFFHAWNVLIDSSGYAWIMPLQSENPEKPKYIENPTGRIYRYFFEFDTDNELFTIPLGDIPPLMRNPMLKDVSADFFGPISIEIDFPETDDKFAYLGVFTHSGWQAVTYQKIEKGKAVFKNMQRNLMYAPLLYNQGEYTRYGDPFVFDIDNKIKKQIPSNSALLDSLRILRKYPLKDKIVAYMHRTYLGEFQGANKPDFSDAICLYKIDNKVIRAYHEIPVHNTRKFKYLRYISTQEDNGGDIAELVFFNDRNEQLTGKIVGLALPSDTLNAQPDKAFDGDPLTFFSSKKGKGWVGLQLNDPEKITKIRYQQHHDDNYIRLGDVYELYIHQSGSWQSYGVQQAVDTVLWFNKIPSGGVYMLKNHTRGREVRPFILVQGEQKFY